MYKDVLLVLLWFSVYFFPFLQNSVVDGCSPSAVGKAFSENGLDPKLLQNPNDIRVLQLVPAAPSGSSSASTGSGSLPPGPSSSDRIPIESQSIQSSGTSQEVSTLANDLFNGAGNNNNVWSFQASSNGLPGSAVAVSALVTVYPPRFVGNGNPKSFTKKMKIAGGTVAANQISGSAQPTNEIALSNLTPTKSAFHLAEHPSTVVNAAYYLKTTTIAYAPTPFNNDANPPSFAHVSPQSATAASRPSESGHVPDHSYSNPDEGKWTNQNAGTYNSVPATPTNFVMENSIDEINSRKTAEGKSPWMHFMTSETVAAELLAMQYNVEDKITNSSSFPFSQTDTTTTTSVYQVGNALTESFTSTSKAAGTSLPRDCAEVLRQDFWGASTSNIYKVARESCEDESTKPPCLFSVYCDLTTDGGGWTVIQQRINSKVSFRRSWAEYKKGFGNLYDNFWIGNDFVHELTNRNNVSYELLVQVETFSDETITALYDNIRVADESQFYKLELGSLYQAGSEVDNFAGNRGQKFGTFDRDTDDHPSISCGSFWRSGWWFDEKCVITGDLNVPFDPVEQLPHLAGIVWQSQKGNIRLKSTQMKVRPSGFLRTR